MDEILCPSDLRAHPKYVPMVPNTETSNEQTPKATDDAICSPSNILVLPTDKNPVMDEITITGISMYVRLCEYITSACL